jgi:hypothetical protein
LAKGTSFELSWEEARKLLQDPARYCKVPPAELHRSTCTLTAEQTRHMINVEFWELLTDDEIENILGICKVFTRDEDWKDPPRARVITWTWTVNLDMSMKPKFALFNQSQVRHLVHRGNHAATYDGKSAFSLWVYDGVEMYYCIKTPLGWVKNKRLSMGSRPAAFISEISMQILAAKSKSFTATYVDNGINIDDDVEVLVTDLLEVKRRADYGDYTFNEDFTNVRNLISQELEFLGAILNFRDKMVSLAPKVLKKLGGVWLRQRDWTVRDYIVCVCVLVYCSNLLGRRMSPWQKVVQVWARLQGQCMFDPAQLDASIDLQPDIVELLEDWVGLTLTNKPVVVPKEGESFDFILVTDACVLGYSSIILSTKTGQTTVVRGEWPPGYYELLKHSTTSEPLAVAVAANTFFLPTTAARVQLLSDNSATVGEVNKGYSTTEGRFLAEHLARNFPELRLSAAHIEGILCPCDEGSRGLKLNRVKLDLLATRVSVVITDIREHVV